MHRSLAAVLLCTSTLLSQGTGVVLQNGVAGHFDVASSPLLAPKSGITIEAWITYDDASIPTGVYRWPTICRKNPAPGLESYFLRVAASNTAARTLDFKVVTASGARRVTWPFQPGQLATPTHLAATYDGLATVLYVNGQSVATSAVAGTAISDTGGVLRVGSGDLSVVGGETWNGLIDELRIWPFARTQAEILASMNESLSGLPGGAISFALDNTYLDSSSQLLGTPSGAIAFAGNSLALTPRIAAAFPFGTPTSTCPGSVIHAIGAPAVVGSAAFSWVAIGAPANGAGLMALAFGSLPAPTVVLGVSIWLDPLTLMTFAAGASALGTSRITLAIPSDPTLVGAGLSSQFVFVDPACGPQGLVASAALAVGIQ